MHTFDRQKIIEPKKFEKFKLTSHMSARQSIDKNEKIIKDSLKQYVMNEQKHPESINLSTKQNYDIRDSDARISTKI